jgi:hypothetical protein
VRLSLSRRHGTVTLSLAPKRVSSHGLLTRASLRARAGKEKHTLSLCSRVCSFPHPSSPHSGSSTRQKSLLTCVFVPTSFLASFRFFNPTEVALSAHQSTRCVHEVPPIQHVLAPLSRSATPVQSPSHESLATHLGRRSLRCACMHACRAKWWNC